MKEQFLSDVAHRVYTMRKEQRLSQEAIAEKAETSKQTISFIEGGKREMLAWNAVKLADALGVSTDYLLKGAPAVADLKRLDNRIMNLTASQYEYLSVVINKFLDLCERNEVK